MSLAIEAFVKHCPPNNLEGLLSLLATKLSGFEQPAIANAQGQKALVDAVRKLRQAATEASLTPPSVIVLGDAATYLAVLAQALGEPELMTQLVTKIPASDLVKQLVANVADVQASTTVEVQTKALIARGGSVPWADLIQAAAEIIRQQNGTQPPTLAALSVVCALYGKDPAAAEAVKQVASEGQLYNRLIEAQNGKKASVVAKAIALLLLNGTDIAPVGGLSWRQRVAASAELVPSVDDLLRAIRPNDSAQLSRSRRRTRISSL